MSGAPFDPDRQRSAADAYAVWADGAYYEPTTDDGHESLGWKRSALDEPSIKVLARVDGDALVWERHDEDGKVTEIARWLP